MVTCPRCQQPVDETVRTTCPLCFTPIPQAGHGPQPGHASGPLTGLSHEPQAPDASPPGHMLPVQSAASPYPPIEMPRPAGPPGPAPMPTGPRPMTPMGARVSLTGEVMDPGMPASSPPSYVGGGGPVLPPRGPVPG